VRSSWDSSGRETSDRATKLGFYPKKRITVQGEFVDFRWINPHALMKVRSHRS